MAKRKRPYRSKVGKGSSVNKFIGPRRAKSKRRHVGRKGKTATMCPICKHSHKVHAWCRLQRMKGKR